MNSLVIAPQNNYNLKTEFSPMYKYLRVPLNLPTSTSISISDTSQLLEWKIPGSRVFNLPRSKISYATTITGPSVGSVIWTHEDVFSLASSIYLGTAGGVDLANVHFANNYSKVTTKQNTKLTDLLSADSASQLYPSNVASQSNYTGYGITSGNLEDPGLAVSSIIESKYLSHGDQAAAAVAAAGGVPAIPAVSGSISKFTQFPLSNIKDTIFSYDKDLYFQNETYLRIQTSPVNKMAFLSPSTTDPFTNSSLISVGPGAGQQTVTLNQVYLYLACEENQIINASIMDKFARNDFKISIQYTIGFLTSSVSTNANVNIQITKQYGKRLLKIVHSVFKANNNGASSYDCNNIAGSKISSYRSSLDSKYLQDYILQCTGPDTITSQMNQDDWFLANSKFCHQSAILNRGVYSRNWFHQDQFYEAHEDIHANDLDVGLELNANTLNYIVECYIPTVQGVAQNLLHHTYVTFKRTYLLNKDGIFYENEQIL